ncbi:MAG: DUF4366 domain-containing protein [Lachnospiraceae bacterium]|nr:DUF4366 domain-containing protein [Lachnospiraceae bacterium]
MTAKTYRKAMHKGVKAGAAMLSFFFLLQTPIVAMANTGNTEAEAAEPEYEESVVKETTEEHPFSIGGNGQLLDDAADDDTKEFLTVQTKNNQTFFVVIDRASNANNVYMLSLIDEDDLSEFITDEKEERTGLSLPEKQEKTEAQLIAEEEAKKEKEAASEAKRKQNGIIHTAIYIAAFIVILIAVCGLYYYLKFYKPKKDEENAGSENLEDPDDFWNEPEEEDEADERPANVADEGKTLDAGFGNANEEMEDIDL